MENKKIYEEASIEIIKFECKDILTASGENYFNDQDDNIDGNTIKTPTIGF